MKFQMTDDALRFARVVVHSSEAREKFFGEIQKESEDFFIALSQVTEYYLDHLEHDHVGAISNSRERDSLKECFEVCFAFMLAVPYHVNGLRMPYVANQLITELCDIEYSKIAINEHQDFLRSLGDLSDKWLAEFFDVIQNNYLYERGGAIIIAITITLIEAMDTASTGVGVALDPAVVREIEEIIKKDEAENS